MPSPISESSVSRRVCITEHSWMQRTHWRVPEAGQLARDVNSILTSHVALRGLQQQQQLQLFRCQPDVLLHHPSPPSRPPRGSLEDLQQLKCSFFVERQCTYVKSFGNLPAPFSCLVWHHHRALRVHAATLAIVFELAECTPLRNDLSRDV